MSFVKMWIAIVCVVYLIILLVVKSTQEEMTRALDKIVPKCVNNVEIISYETHCSIHTSDMSLYLRIMSPIRCTKNYTFIQIGLLCYQR